MKRFFLILGFLLIVFSVQPAMAKSYTVDSVDIKAALQSDGSAAVTENITMTFDGDFSRFVRDMALSDEYFVSDIMVKENGVEYKRLDAFDPSRPAGCWAAEEKDGKLVIEFYYRTQKETRTFEVSYLIENAVIVHNDVVELNRKFIDVGWDKIKKLDITVILPAGTAKKDIKVWSHGLSWGRADIISDSEVHYKIEGLPQDTFAEVRVTAPRSLFPSAEGRQSGKEALPGIIAQEQKWADEANAERERRNLEYEQVRERKELWEKIIAALIAINCVLAVFLAKRQINKNKPMFSPQYYRNLPSDISPAELGELYAQGSGKVGKSTLYVATILDLSLKKFLEIKARPLPGRKAQPEDITINLNTQGKDTAGLLRHESILLAFINAAFGKKTSGSMAGIKKYTQESKSEAGEFLISFDSEIANSIETKNYLHKETKPGISFSHFIFAVLVPVTIALAFALIFESELLLIASVCYLFFGAFAMLKTKLGIRFLYCLIAVPVAIAFSLAFILESELLLIASVCCLFCGVFAMLNTKLGISFLYCLIAAPVAIAFSLAFMHESALLIMASLCHLVFYVFVAIKTRCKLSRKGIEELALWKGFKNFLKEFTLFDEKELPDLVVWQKYLVYATVLGEAKALLKQLPRIYPQLADPDYLERHNELWLLTAMNDENNNLFAVFDSVGKEMSETTRIASSSYSSGSGDGGGSSGGNSGGDSGGGGRAD